MSRVAINTGASANDGTGDNLRSAGGILNSNFLELYTYLGAGSTTILSAPLWSSTNVGINTLKNVGIGTTNPTSALTVIGNGTFTGIVTATTFIGALTGNATNATLSTNAQGLTGTPNLNVGVVTASRLNVGTSGTVITTTASGLVGIGTTNPRFALEVGAVGASGTTLFVNGDARVTGIVTIGPASITLNGATNIINVGTGITLNGTTGIISATAIVLGGTTLTGAAVTSITAGSGISVNSSTGNVTITATGGGGSSQFVTTAAGIHTLSNVGIGTTNPLVALDVAGAIRQELHTPAMTVGLNNDIGKNWTKIEMGANTKISAFAYCGNGIVLAGTGDADGDIYRSTDFGLTFTKIEMGAGLESIRSFLYCGNGIVLAGSGNDSGDGDIYRSTDFGLTFTKIELEPPGAGLEIIYSIVYCGNGIVLAGSGFASAGDGDIYRSTDFGLTFTKIEMGASLNRISSIVYCGNGIVVAGGDASQGIYRSTNFGLTWTTIQGALPVLGLNWSLVYCGNGIVLVGGGAYSTADGGDIYRSTDFGLTWNKIEMGAGLESIRSLVYCGNGIVLAGGGDDAGDGDIYRSTNFGLTFTKIEFGAGIESIWSLVYCGNGIVLAGGGDDAGDGNIYRSDVGFSQASTIQGIYHQHLTGNVGLGTTNPTSKLTVSGNVKVVGVVTATSFSGDGSGLTGVIGSGSGVVIKDSGSTVGTAGTIDFGDNLTVSAISAGIVTVTGSASGGSGIGLSISDTPPANTTAYPLWYSSLLGRSFVYYNDGNSSQWVDFSPTSSGASGGSGSSQFVTTAAGIHTLSNVGIGTTNPTSALTVKGNTSLETLNVSGVSTFAGITTVTGTTLFAKQLNVSGISTFNAKVKVLNDLEVGEQADALSIGLKVWNGNAVDSYLELFGGSNEAYIRNTGTTANGINISATGSVAIGGGGTGSWSILANPDGSVSLALSVIEKLRTIGAGVTVTGTTFTNNLSVSGIASVGTGITMYGSTGIISATTFYGNVVGNISGSITDATNLTGGYANASSLNVSGVATISQGRIQADGSSNLRFGNLAAGSGSGRNIAIGDQVLYSLSGGQGRNIGIGELSYYDTTSGQYNIGLGIQAGQKITTGNYNVILGGYDGQTGLDIRTSSNNVVIADGQGNIRQYINSSGNVGIKTTVITEALTVAGIVSATSFYGTLNAGQLTGTLPAINGSALIGVVGSGSGIIIQGDTTPVGTAGTINFGSNINVTFASGIATVSVPSVTYANVAGVATVATNAQGLTGTPSITVTNVTANRFILPNCGNISDTDNTEKLTFGTTPDFKIYHLNQSGIGTQNRIEVKTHPLYIGTIESYMGDVQEVTVFTNLISVIPGTPGTNTSRVVLGFGGTSTTYVLQTTGYGVSITGGIIASGIITASSFSGSGSGLTNIPAAQLTGTLPAIDGSALLNVNAVGTGIAIRDDNSNIGSATTVNFGTGLDVTFSAGIATITASGGSLQSRTTVSGVTTSIANLGIGNTNITGFKSYALMKVGLSTAGWLRLYTDNTSRANDASRSVGEDPAPGSGVIAEVVTTGITTTQIISPFVMGGNLDNSPTTTIYASIKNLSGSTQTITANLTILQLEA